MNPDDDELYPAEPEDIQNFIQQFIPAVTKLLKGAFEHVGHSFLSQNALVHQFTTISGLRGMVENRSLWSTPVGYLNDATEYRHGRDMFLALIDELRADPSNGNWNDVLLHLRTSLKEATPNNVFVACFTSSFDQLSQWRGYGADGYGYSVGFDTAHFVAIKPDTIVFNVFYKEEMQKQFCDVLLRRGIVEINQLLVIARIEPTPELIAKLLKINCEITVSASPQEHTPVS